MSESGSAERDGYAAGFAMAADAEVGSRPTSVGPVRVTGLWKVYRSGDGSELEVLRGLDLDVGEGEAVAIVGESGAGKSTLLHLVGGLDQPTRGRIAIGGESLDGLSAVELSQVRNRRIGFVFQFHHLLREFSARENVMMPCLVAGVDPEEAKARADELLSSVGLAPRAEHRPSELSGGEQQRVAVARALANRPTVLLADEPSGNLDMRTSEQLHDVLFQVRETEGLAMVLVTHNLELAKRADRILELGEGVLRPYDGSSRQPGPATGVGDAQE